MGENPGKVIGQVVINFFDNGTANMQVTGTIGPFTVFNGLHNLAENFRAQMAVQEQQSKVVIPHEAVTTFIRKNGRL